MARILFNEEWYETISPSGLYEEEFERILLERAHILYPRYFTIPFKKIVQSDNDSAEADLALIDMQYRNWWVVEVEMANHSLDQHVIPQVETLSDAYYGTDEADYLANQKPDLDYKKLLDMMKGVQPRVLVLVNGNAPGWKESLSRYNAILQIIEIFRSEKNHHIVRINGENPTTSEMQVVSICRPDPDMPRLLIVDSPAGLGVRPNQKINIEFEGGVTEWERIDARSRVWLNPPRRNPLQTYASYQVVRDENGALHFEIAPKRRK